MQQSSLSYFAPAISLILLLLLLLPPLPIPPFLSVVVAVVVVVTVVVLAAGIDEAVLCYCPGEAICRFGSCCNLQSRFPSRRLCYIDDIVFAAVLVAAGADLFAQDNHGAR